MRAQAFKEQRYPEAVKHYSEALSRGPPEVHLESSQNTSCDMRYTSCRQHPKLPAQQGGVQQL